MVRVKLRISSGLEKEILMVLGRESSVKSKVVSLSSGDSQVVRQTFLDADLGCTDLWFLRCWVTLALKYVDRRASEMERYLLQRHPSSYSISSTFCLISAAELETGDHEICAYIFKIAGIRNK
jgi:hypothetical protein